MITKFDIQRFYITKVQMNKSIFCLKLKIAVVFFSVLMNELFSFLNFYKELVCDVLNPNYLRHLQSLLSKLILYNSHDKMVIYLTNLYLATVL